MHHEKGLYQPDLCFSKHVFFQNFVIFLFWFFLDFFCIDFLDLRFFSFPLAQILLKSKSSPVIRYNRKILKRQTHVSNTHSHTPAHTHMHARAHQHTYTHTRAHTHMHHTHTQTHAQGHTLSQTHS